MEAVNMNRREFITSSASAAVGMAGVWMARRVYGAEGAAKQVRVRLGFLSDSHYANVDYAIPAQVTKSRNTNSFAEVDILDDGSAAITGYFLAQSWKK